MYIRLFWFPEPLNFLCYSTFIEFFLYTRSASKDYMIFEKQPALISNKINVSSKKKNQFCAQNIEPWGVRKTICCILVWVNHKCQHLLGTEIHFKINLTPTASCVWHRKNIFAWGPWKYKQSLISPLNSHEWPR